MREEFINFPRSSSEKHFVIELAGVSYCDGSYEIRRDKSPCLVMEYVIKGEGTILLNGRTYSAKEGDIYLLPAGEVQFYYSDSKNPWEKIWFNANGTLLSSLLQEYNPRKQVVFPDAGGREYFEKIHEIGKDNNYSAVEKHRKAALVFHELLQYLYDKFYGNECLYSKETILLKEYLDNHVTENISLKEMGDLVYLSESQVVRLFKRDLKMTPHEYSLHLKLELAKKLLQSTRLMVREIAGYLGFCDEHYFSYIFKKKAGCTPLEYRKRGEGGQV